MTDHEPLYRSRPGAFDIRPASAAAATEVTDGIWVSPGLSNSYLLTTGDGRIVVNTGMGFEAPVHRANFDAVDAGRVRYVILTQGHYDHVGGIDVLRDPDSEIVAQANWRTWRDDNERLEPFRVANSAFAWIEAITAAIDHARARTGRAEVPPQSKLEPTITVDDTWTLELGGRRVELHATPGGETTDSLVVWLPEQRVCLCGNVFGALFGHIPNLVTMRGDRYRDALVFIESLERVRALHPEILLTGHHGPIVGDALIDAELVRLRDAVRHVHDETVRGMNAGVDVHTLMRDITLPPELEVGQGYGMVRWDVRAVWENYAGWFHHRSTTELYPVPATAVHGDLVELAGGPDVVVARAAAHLQAGRTLEAIHLAEIARHADPAHEGAREVLLAAHEGLLAASENFWETSWLREQLADLGASPPPATTPPPP
ncbi:MAG: MBL fold metallo-hydrolase [Acidimicrobiales bacterium]|nr:MBL fold metallo-hydrolase [Acidimicrobiales bacterium]